MVYEVTSENLHFFEALASESRLNIIKRLADGDCNIKDLAESLGLSSAIVTKHVKKLETAGIIKTRMVKKDGSIQKICTLLNFEYRLHLPVRLPEEREFHEFSIPVGQYTDFDIQPTCGLANENHVIGYFDDPRCFLDPERVTAQIIWFSQGYVEYQFPNFLSFNEKIQEIEFSMELCSEAPGFNDDCPSDISFLLNGTKLCQWTSPGDFGKRRGVLTPSWWEVNQYGLLKTIRINYSGVYLDGNRQGRATLRDVPTEKQKWTLRFEVPPDAKNVGGFTLFGKKFGSYQQDIVVRTYYVTQKLKTSEMENTTGANSRTQPVVLRESGVPQTACLGAIHINRTR